MPGCLPPGLFSSKFNHSPLYCRLSSWLALFLQGFHLLWLNFPVHSNSSRSFKALAGQPHYGRGPGWFIPRRTAETIRFRSPLLTESRLISFPRVTKMFQFTQFLLPGPLFHRSA